MEEAVSVEGGLTQAEVADAIYTAGSFQSYVCTLPECVEFIQERQFDGIQSADLINLNDHAALTCARTQQGLREDDHKT